MRRALLVGVLSVLVIVPASVGIYMLAFGEEAQPQEQYSSPAKKVVTDFVSMDSDPETLNPSDVYNARKSKSQLNDALVANADTSAERTGTSSEEVASTVEGMEIKNWESTSLPETAAEDKCFEMELDGNVATITTYSYPDDEYVTISSEDCTLTLRGPEEAGNDLAELAAA